MFVCICNAVTERQIRLAAADGVTTLPELARQTGCADCCGTCADEAERVLRRAVAIEARGGVLPRRPAQEVPPAGQANSIPLFRTAFGPL